jgi:alpha-1,6-mannosyltransferase
MTGLPLSIFGIVLDKRLRQLALPSLCFIGLLSALGHKEWRFIIYVVPIFNVCAAKALAWLFSRPKSSVWGKLCFAFAISCIGLNILATTGTMIASVENYPGGVALDRFNRIYADSQGISSLNYQPVSIH